METNLSEKIWWSYIQDDLKELLLQSLLLIDTADKWEKEEPEKYQFHDYSFIVFPVAKAYEGFLKKMFLDLGFITDEDYNGKRFRVGKALNPALEAEYRDREGVFDKIVKYCGGKELAEKLWLTWKECRNLVFHWFPHERNAVTLEEAKEKVNMVITAIDFAFRECKVDRR